ncbi:MAG: hypothetical protein V1859_08970 [archaeon]
MGWGKYLTLLVILFLNTLAMILLVFKLKQSFYIEFFMMLVFLITAIIILAGAYHDKNWSWKLATIYFLVYLINACYLYLFVIRISSKFSLTTLLSAIGFLMSTMNLTNEDTLKKKIQTKKDEKIETYGAKTEFTPGKYLASSSGNVYHIPKCDWAKRINRNNRMWLLDKAEAKNKGYKKHSCVK